MEPPLCNVSVRAMKGRFEMVHEGPTRNKGTFSKSPNNRGHLSQRRISPAKSVSSIRDADDSEAKSAPRDRNSFAFEETTDENLPHLRNRSMSIGNCNSPKEHSKNFRNNESIRHLEKHPERGLASFTEKQRLVESIVRNIKNASKNENDLKIKQKQTMTSKLEKDIKNALEKGVRKWNNTRNKEKLSKENLHISSPIINYKECNTFREEISPILNWDPDYSGKQNDIRSYTKEAESNRLKTVNKSFDSQYSPQSNGFQGNIERNEDDFKENFYQEMDFYDQPFKKSYEGPTRPPRRRNSKKPKAPQPPKLKKSQVTGNKKHEGEIVYYSTPCDDYPEQPILYKESNVQETNPQEQVDDTRFCQTHIPPSLSKGIPPQKPPRTFAHDIYKSTKPKIGEKQMQQPKNGMSMREIEALYTKPMKRVAIKDPKKITDQECSNDVKTKPNIAPKPADIVERTKKRYSVADPISSPREEMLDRSSSIKRNSSFRLSLRKMKRFTSPKQDGQIGKRWRQIARNLSFQKDELQVEEESTRQRSKSEEILCSGASQDPIYAVPLDPSVKRRGASQELHYMCSPLFDEENEAQPLKLQHNSRNPSSRVQFSSNEPVKSGRQAGIMDGLRREFRQSYRFLQKRLASR